MKQTILHSTLRELQRIVCNPRIWIVFAAVVFLFTVSGPFGTFGELPFHARLGYWLVMQLLSWALALTFVSFFDIALEQVWIHALPRMLVGAALAALPIGVVVTLVNAAFLGTSVSPANIQRDTMTALPVALALCLLAWMALVRTAPSADEQAVTADPDAAPAGDPPRPAILDRLPLEKRGNLVRMEVEDHYVRVVTSNGTELLLMRLADAIREAEGADGMQVHRSHWVARDGVERLDREPGRNGRAVLKAADGAAVPVSRANVAKVKSWLG